MYYKVLFLSPDYFSETEASGGLLLSPPCDVMQRQSPMKPMAGAECLRPRDVDQWQLCLLHHRNLITRILLTMIVTVSANRRHTASTFYLN